MNYVFFKQVNEQIQLLNIEIQLFDQSRISLTNKEVAINISNINKKIEEVRKSYLEQSQELNKKLFHHKNQVLNISTIKNRIKSKDYSVLFKYELNRLKELGVIFDNEVLIQTNQTKDQKKQEKSKILNFFKQAKKEINEEYKKIIGELSIIERKINDIEHQERKINGKSLLEKSYFSAAIFLASLPILSGLGLSILLLYLSRIGSSIFFMDIASEGGILFSISLGSWFALTQLLIPYVIILSQKETDGKFWIFSTLILFFLCSIFISWVGFWVISSIAGAIIPAIIWNIIVFFIWYLYRNAVVKKHKYNMTIPIILIMPVILTFMTTYFSQALSTFGLSTGLRLENILRTIEFSQKGYSWFKVNDTYFDRTGLAVDTLREREKEFLPQHKNLKIKIKKPNEGIILYGKLWVNSPKIKILCPPKSLKNNEERDSPLDISYQEVSQKCIQFQADDLQNLMGLISEIDTKNSKP